MVSTSDRYGRQLARREFLKAVGVGATGLLVIGPWGARAGSPSPLGPGAADGDPVAHLATALGLDVERIFRFVADDVRYQPYAGVLRGARGTLSARAGNSADQALLLAALLDHAGVPYRFAFGAIDQAMASALLAGTVADVETLRRDALAAFFGIGARADRMARPAGATQGTAAATRDGERASAWASEQLDRHVTGIESALVEAGIVIPGGATGVPVREREQHVWVQASSGDGWLDLDPSLPGGSLGQSLSSGASFVDALPDDLRHRVELAVIVETVAGLDLEERQVLGVSAPADVLTGEPIIVLNVPPQGIPGLPADITGDLEGTKEYRAALIIGEESHVSEVPIVFKTGGGLLGGLGDNDGEATAQWVQVTIHSPDVEPVIIRREVFDRLGPAARAHGGLDLASLPPVTRLDLGPQLAGEYPPALTQHWLVVSVGPPSLADLQASLRADDDPAAPANVLQQYRLLGEAAGHELATSRGVRPFVDAPNVVAYTIAIRPHPDGAMWATASLDIWHRSHGSLPVLGVSPDSSPSVIIGVLPHVVERLLLADAAPSRRPGVGGMPVSVGAVFDEVSSSGGTIRVVRGPDEANGLAYDADTLARLRAALADGLVALAPEHPVLLGDRERTGWWLVDPVTGRTLDQLDDGGGQNEAIEYFVNDRTVEVIYIERVIVLRQSVWRAACIAGGTLAATALLVEAASLASVASSADPWAGFWGVVAGGPALGGAAAGALQACIQG